MPITIHIRPLGETPEEPALALYDEFMLFYCAWARIPKGTEYTEDAYRGGRAHESGFGNLQNGVNDGETEARRKLGEIA